MTEATPTPLWERDIPTGKPRNPSEAICPIVDRQCNVACHKCEFWEGFPCLVDAKEQTEWRCAFRWSAVQGPILAKRLDGIQKACEQTRNQVNEWRGSNSALIGALLRSKSINPDTVRELPAPAAPLMEDQEEERRALGYDA